MVISLFCFTHWKETTHDCCPTAANSLWGPLPEPPAQGPLMPLIALWCQHGHPQHTAPPPTTTLAARGNSCIREEPKQQFSNVLSKELNHTPHTSYPVPARKKKSKGKAHCPAPHMKCLPVILRKFWWCFCSSFYQTIFLPTHQDDFMQYLLCSQKYLLPWKTKCMWLKSEVNQLMI